MGRLSLRSTSDPVLYSMQLRYDEDRMRPIHRFDAESRRATLGFEANPWVIASFEHAGLTKRGGFYHSDNWDDAKVRMRVRAETVFGAVEIDRSH